MFILPSIFLSFLLSVHHVPYSCSSSLTGSECSFFHPHFFPSFCPFIMFPAHLLVHWLDQVLWVWLSDWSLSCNCHWLVHAKFSWCNFQSSSRWLSRHVRLDPADRQLTLALMCSAWHVLRYVSSREEEKHTHFTLEISAVMGFSGIYGIHKYAYFCFLYCKM